MNKCFKSFTYILMSVIVEFLFTPISSANSLTDIYVVLQGNNRTDPQGWEIPITVSFFEPGANVHNDPNIYSFSLVTYKSGDYAVCQIFGVSPDTYDITVVSEHTLLNVKRNVLISSPTNMVNMGTLLEGNADDNNVINLKDFAILASAWLTSNGPSFFDTRADFDRNLDVNTLDLRLLTKNWLRSAPIEIPLTTEITGVCNRVMCELIEPEQEIAEIVLTGRSSIHLISDFFSEFTTVEMSYGDLTLDISEYCEIRQNIFGPLNHIDVHFNTFYLPIGPRTWAFYTIQLHPMPPAPTGAKTSDDIWIFTNGSEL